MSRRVGVGLLALVLIGLAAGTVLVLRQSGRIGERVALADVSAADLDTVSVDGRRVDVSLSGIVTQVGPGDEVWLSVGGDAAALRFPEGAVVEVEDHLLVVGALHSWRGRRWVDVSGWSQVEASVRPPSAPDP